jgi:hypothetical protein
MAGFSLSLRHTLQQCSGNLDLPEEKWSSQPQAL